MTDTSSTFSSLSDSELFHRCEQYGRAALLWRNKFRALLPEVERRKLYAQKGYSSIYVFGKMLAGLSEEQVAESLNIIERLQDKPTLKKLLNSGEVSVNKIRRVMPIATPENESELAEKVRLLSVGALKVFVRDVRHEMDSESDEAEIWDVPKTQTKSIFSQENSNDLGLNEDVMRKLYTLKEKGIDINDELLAFLNQREQELEEQKHDIVQSLPKESGRYIPARVRNVLSREYGTKCAKYGCNKLSRQIHHTARYSLTRSHDPNYLAPLCREHHQIAHAIDVKVQDKKWGQ